jgi:hypothetical protein
MTGTFIPYYAKTSLADMSFAGILLGLNYVEKPRRVL